MNEMVGKEELGRRLHLLRWGHWTLREIQIKTGIPQSNVSRWERGIGKRYPDLDGLAALAALYGVAVSDLLDPDYDTRVWSNGITQVVA